MIAVHRDHVFAAVLFVLLPRVHDENRRSNGSGFEVKHLAGRPLCGKQRKKCECGSNLTSSGFQVLNIYISYLTSHILRAS